MITVFAVFSLAAAAVHAAVRSASVGSDCSGLIGSAYVEPTAITR